MVLAAIRLVYLLIDTFILIFKIVLEHVTNDCTCHYTIVASSSYDKVAVSKLINHLISFVFIVFVHWLILTIICLVTDCMLEYLVFRCGFECLAGFDNLGTFWFYIHWVVLLHHYFVRRHPDFTHAHQIQELSNLGNRRQTGKSDFFRSNSIFILCVHWLSLIGEDWDLWVWMHLVAHFIV